jgi:ribosomal-protein-alanine N-acetyltransferase
MPVAADAAIIFQRYASDDTVTKYLGWPTHRTVADTQDFLAVSALQWEREGAGPYLIWGRADGRLLGSTGLGLELNGQAITGYVLAADAWGKGYATEALTAMVDVASDIGLRQLYALCHPQHRASIHVLGKCGFGVDESWHRQLEFPNLAAGTKQDVLCFRRALNRRAG